VTPSAALLADLRARGLRLRRDGEEILVAPRGLLTAADRAHLVESKSGVLDLLNAEAATPPPADPCGLCAASDWTSATDWPEPCLGRWLCTTCINRPVPTLDEVADTLTPEEHDQLHVEAAAGDALAGAVLRHLMPPEGLTGPENAAAWLLYSRGLDRELWLVRDEAACTLLSAADMDGRVVVLADELIHLTGLDNSSLQAVLDVKVALDAEVIGIAPEMPPVCSNDAARRPSRA
jgi:hypothetical protein